jgi:hypothetical protein
MGIGIEFFRIDHLDLPRPVELSVKDDLCVLSVRSLNLSVAELLIPVIGQAPEFLEIEMSPETFKAGLVDVTANIDFQDCRTSLCISPFRLDTPVRLSEMR